jgi:hypothetical protein
MTSSGTNGTIWYGNDVRGGDRSNNIERVLINNPIKGSYTITVSAHYLFVLARPQNYSLVVLGGIKGTLSSAANPAFKNKVATSAKQTSAVGSSAPQPAGASSGPSATPTPPSNSTLTSTAPSPPVGSNPSSNSSTAPAQGGTSSSIWGALLPLLSNITGGTGTAGTNSSTGSEQKSEVHISGTP